jgi:hypothetical protein
MTTAELWIIWIMWIIPSIVAISIIVWDSIKIEGMTKGWFIGIIFFASWPVFNYALVVVYVILIIVEYYEDHEWKMSEWLNSPVWWNKE